MNYFEKLYLNLTKKYKVNLKNNTTFSNINIGNITNKEIFSNKNLLIQKKYYQIIFLIFLIFFLFLILKFF